MIKPGKGAFNFNWAQSMCLINGWAHWNSQKRTSQLLNVPSYPSAFMLMHSTFSFVIIHAATQNQSLSLGTRFHLLSPTQGYYSRNSHFHNSSIIFTSLLDHSYYLQICSLFLPHRSPPATPIFIFFFLEKLEDSFFNSPPPILYWTHSNQVSPSLSTKIALLKVICWAFCSIQWSS